VASWHVPKNVKELISFWA
jgi:hypothetical protein